jgi:hypothetical protein
MALLISRVHALLAEEPHSDGSKTRSWTKTLHDSRNLGTIDVLAYLIVLGMHGTEAQAHPATISYREEKS